MCSTWVYVEEKLCSCGHGGSSKYDLSGHKRWPGAEHEGGIYEAIQCHRHELRGLQRQGGKSRVESAGD